MIGLILLALLFIGVPVLFYLSIKADKKEWEKREAIDNAWLKEEMEKPKFAIQFTTIDSTVKETQVFDPYQTHPGSDWNMRRTSKRAAEMMVDISYERGYFRDKDGVTYPTCNVKEAVLKEV